MHKGLNSPHLLLASSNPYKILENLTHVLNAAELTKITTELDRNASLLFRLGEAHYNFALPLTNADWRQKISRLYYGVYNVRRAVQLKFNGNFSTDSSDHNKIDQLPDVLVNKDSHAINLRNLREDRNLADYNHMAAIAESLTIDKYSFGDDFFARYTTSVTGFENQITANANFVVYGRRGAGKSSLLSYALHKSKAKKSPTSWIAMQTYANRSDFNVVPTVIAEILHEIDLPGAASFGIKELKEQFDQISEGSAKSALAKCDRLIPRTRRVLASVATTQNPMTIFLDDIHVLNEDLQPIVLSFIYKITRGNNIFIKASGIGQLTKLWDSAQSVGLQAPHDVQVLNLDHNLTMPDKSKGHIVGILDTHALFCGLPDISYLAGDQVLSRLVLEAAGVPRDALNLLSIAISKAAARSQKMVSVASVNAAASEMAEEKLKDIERDSGSDVADIQKMLGEVKDFCITKNRKNAFLMEIKNQSRRYQLMQKLAALRLVHILHEGITPHRAGKRFVALMLDYGFYVGIRAARSVQLIPSEPRALPAKELRSLPIFH